MRRLAWSRAQALCGLLFLAPSSHVAAQLPAGVSIQWNGPPSCPRATLDAELARRIDAQAEQAQQLKVDVQVRELAETFELSLVMDGDAGSAERKVALATCEEVRRAAAVLIATALTHHVEQADAPPPPSSWSLRLGVLGDLRSLPQVSGGPMFGVGYDFLRRSHVWLDLRYLAARKTESSPGDLQAQVDLFAAALGGSYAFSHGPFSVGPGVELELGALRGKVIGERAGGSRSAPWVSGWGGATAGYAVGRATIGFSVLVGAPLLRPAFVWGAEADPYRTRALGMRAQLGISIRLGPKKNAEPGQ